MRKSVLIGISGLAGILLAAATAGVSVAAELEKPQMPLTRLVMLGVGNPNAEPDRSGPSVAVIVGDRPFIVDFGPGLVRRATAARRLHGIEALRVENLNHAFVTHLHTDHTAGYPDLIFTPWVLGREVPLKVFGPPGTKAMTGHILKAYAQDIALRLDGLEPANDQGWRVEARDIDEGLVYDQGGVRIEAFRVCHGGWPVALGYRFTTPDRVIVISGDTTYCPNLVKWAHGADILLHEVYSQRAWEERPAVWKTYHKAFHTSAPDLARIAAEVKPGLLVLYHQVYWSGATDEEIIAEIRRTYGGKVVAAEDLDVF